MILIVLCVASVIIALLAYLRIMVKRHRDVFEERFPPISDAEFVARCAPGTSPQVPLKVRRIVADSLGVEYERIYPSSRFVEDLGVD
jgi:hypothetical protein